MERTCKIGAVLIGALLSGCAAQNPGTWAEAQPVKATPATQRLQSLPAAGQRVAIAVYNFSDQTGQFKPTDGVQTLSRAVTQGATSILIKALQEAGNGEWFTVIERERLDNVLRERAVIREMRSSYLGEKVLNRQALPPLLFAGILLEGGVVGYDSNTKTGGIGARFLGIGADAKYREDTVTVYLRAVSVKTGEVLSSVSVRKSIAAVGAGANAFRYVAFRELLEAETGFTYNEPDALALQQAIEEAVYSLILEGSIKDLWCLSAQPVQAAQLARKYISRRDNLSESEVALPRRADGSERTGSCASRAVAQRPSSRPAQQPSAQLDLAEPARASLAPLRMITAPAVAKNTFVTGTTAPAAPFVRIVPSVQTPLSEGAAASAISATSDGGQAVRVATASLAQSPESIVPASPDPSAPSLPIEKGPDSAVIVRPVPQPVSAPSASGAPLAAAVRAAPEEPETMVTLSARAALSPDSPSQASSTTRQVVAPMPDVEPSSAQPVTTVTDETTGG